MTYISESFRLTEYEVALEPEQRLWRAVLACAVRDITHNGKFANAAKRWMCTRDHAEGFNRACNLAGYDPTVFREAVVKYITREKGEWTDPPTLDKVMLSGRIFNVRHLGLPAHEAVAHLQGLMTQGHKFRRVNSDGGYVATKPARKKIYPEEDVRKINSMILSGAPFDAGPAGNYTRYRIQTLRKRGYEITALGKSRFIFKNVVERPKSSQNSMSSD